MEHGYPHLCGVVGGVWPVVGGCGILMSLSLFSKVHVTGLYLEEKPRSGRIHDQVYVKVEIFDQ